MSGRVKGERFVLKWVVTAILITGGTPALAAEHLDCMSLPLGAAEQSLLDRHYSAERGDDRRNLAIGVVLNGRAQACGYLYGWSEKALRLAAHHRWLQIQRKALERFNHYSADEEARLNVALAPRMDRLISLFKADVDAVVANVETPPPEEDAFREFKPMIKDAKLTGENASEENLGVWLYQRGSIMALERAFQGS